MAEEAKSRESATEAKAEEPNTSKTAAPSSPPPSSSSLHESLNEKEERLPKPDGAPITPQKSIEQEYPPMRKVLVIMFALYLSFFLVALDRTIIATAIPRITDDFNSLGDVGWYGSSYMLTGCAFMLLLGRVYTFYSPKIVYLSCVLFFEIGSAICGAAPNSTAFIIGRAVAGAGTSGIFSGAIVIILYVVPLHKRPVFQGLIGAVFGVASVAGPLLGGVFTSKVSWRWCFYINLPIGGFAMVVLFFILELPPPKNAGTSWKDQIGQLDPIGTALFLPGVVCLLLALQWGGSTYKWSDGRIIALLVLFAILIIGFLSVQLWLKDRATVPPHIVKQRSMIAGMWAQFSTGSAMMILVYYIPIWFQAIKGVSAVKSGVMNLPLILSLVVATITTGFLVSKTGYYTPFMISSSVIMSIGAGLITTWTPTTNHSEWIAYQFIFGFGLGQGMQQATLAAQAVLHRKDAPIGITLIMFFQQLGGAIFVSIGQNIFSNKLTNGLRNIPGLDLHSVVTTGATELRDNVDPSSLKMVLAAYNGALVHTFRAALAMACLSILGSASMEWRNIKPKKGQKGEGSGGASESKEDAATANAKLEAKMSDEV